jgi:importin-9
VLFCVVQKIYKTRMPSTLQSLVLIFARLIQTNPKEIVELLSETSVDNRISLKVVLDKWLLQQPLFRGPYTKIVTMSALQKLFFLRDSRIESLMVIGYNPSHSNINSEVNAPFKILSTLMRFLENERQGHAAPYEESSFGNYQMQRDNRAISGERLDTMEGRNDLYYDEEDEEEQLSEKLDTSQEKIEVNLDDIEDEDDQECLLDYKQNEMNQQTKKEEFDPVHSNLFKIKESQDKGLADMETGSEVYMSELLVSCNSVSNSVGWFRHGGLGRRRRVERGGPAAAEG